MECFTVANAKKKCSCGDNEAYAIFKISADGAAWGSIVGDINLQEDLMALLTNYFSIENMKTTGNIKITKDDDGNYNIATETFEFEQAEASDSWVIEHNLNKFPTVITVDSAGTQFQGEVTYDSLNKVTISINGATKGRAYLN